MYSPRSCSSNRRARCVFDSFGCFPFSLPLARATAIPSRVRMLIRSRSNSATMASTLNSSRPTGSVGSYRFPPRLSATPFVGQLIRDLARIPQRPGEPVEFRHDERVSASHRGKRLPQARSGAIRAGHAVVDVDVRVVERPDAAVRRVER